MEVLTAQYQAAFKWLPVKDAGNAEARPFLDFENPGRFRWRMKKQMFAGVWILQLHRHQAGHPQPFVIRPRLEDIYLSIPLATCFNFRPKLRSTIAHSSFEDSSPAARGADSWLSPERFPGMAAK